MNDNKDNDKELDIVDLRQLRARIRDITDNMELYKDTRIESDCEKLFDEC